MLISVGVGVGAGVALPESNYLSAYLSCLDDISLYKVPVYLVNCIKLRSSLPPRFLNSCLLVSPEPEGIM